MAGANTREKYPNESQVAMLDIGYKTLVTTVLYEDWLLTTESGPTSGEPINQCMCVC